MNPMERKAFSFLRSFYDAAKMLNTKEEQADFLLAVCNYGLNGVEPEVGGTTSAMFQLVKPNLDSALAKAIAGAKGGKAERKRTEANESKVETNDKQNEANESNPEPIKDKGLRIKDKGLKEKVKKEKPPKHQYGEYKNVLLSDEELEKLKTEFPTDWQDRIERVSGYCRQYGKSYSDYLATIRNWARKENKEAVNRPLRKNDAQAGYQRTLELLGIGEEAYDETTGQG